MSIGYALLCTHIHTHTDRDTHAYIHRAEMQGFFKHFSWISLALWQMFRIEYENQL